MTDLNKTEKALLVLLLNIFCAILFLRENRKRTIVTSLNDNESVSMQNFRNLNLIGVRSVMIKIIVTCLPSPAAPNPPTVTVTPLYNSSGDLLEIKTQAAEGVGCNVQFVLVVMVVILNTSLLLLMSAKEIADAKVVTMCPIHGTQGHQNCWQLLYLT